MLSGYKTYVICAVTIVLILLEVILGVDIPNYDPGPDWMNDVLAMLGLGALRAGVAKT